MKVQSFNQKEPSSKKQAKAVFFLDRLKSLEQAELPCDDYQSAIDLANILSRIDRERICQSIHIYGHFVRIYRNEKGSFAFAPVIIDQIKRRIEVQDEYDRP